MCIRDRVIGVVELEKEWQERLDEYVGQRVNFPLICEEPRCSKMLLLQGKSPLLVEDLSCFPFLYELHGQKIFKPFVQLSIMQSPPNVVFLHRAMSFPSVPSSQKRIVSAHLVFLVPSIPRVAFIADIIHRVCSSGTCIQCKVQKKIEIVSLEKKILCAKNLDINQGQY